MTNLSAIVEERFPSDFCTGWEVIAALKPYELQLEKIAWAKKTTTNAIMDETPYILKPTDLNEEPEDSFGMLENSWNTLRGRHFQR